MTALYLTRALVEVGGGEANVGGKWVLDASRAEDAVAEACATLDSLRSQKADWWKVVADAEREEEEEEEEEEKEEVKGRKGGKGGTGGKEKYKEKVESLTVELHRVSLRHSRTLGGRHSTLPATHDNIPPFPAEEGVGKRRRTARGGGGGAGGKTQSVKAEGVSEGRGAEEAYGLRLARKGKPVVVDVFEGGSAEALGVCVGDLVAEVGEQPVDTLAQLRVALHNWSFSFFLCSLSFSFFLLLSLILFLCLSLSFSLSLFLVSLSLSLSLCQPRIFRAPLCACDTPTSRKFLS